MSNITLEKPHTSLYEQYAEYVGDRRILVVDDEAGVRKSLALYLQRCGFQVDEAENGSAARDMLEQGDYFLVITDITMPGMNGLELLMFIKGLDRSVDVVMITGHMNIEFAIEAMKKGAFDYLKKPFMLEEVRSAIIRVLDKEVLTRKSIELERLKERQRSQEDKLKETMTALARAIDGRSSYTGKHSERVSAYSAQIGLELGLPEEEQKRLVLGAKLHDIGKITIPDYILDKPGPLTREEMDIMKTHPAKGAELIQDLPSLMGIIDIVRHHHENNDGTGYPDGLTRDEIPYLARIVKIADYYDAITSTRPYRKPMSREKAVEILLEEVRNGRVEEEFVHALFSRLKIPVHV